MEQVPERDGEILTAKGMGLRKMEKELVSIIVRTCNRPHILREALESIRRQTYPNIEVVVAEDGANTAQEMLETEFSDMNIRYACTGERKGRTVVGNLALSMASGAYMNFLDDDDVLFPGHVEVLMEALSGAKERAAYSVAYESVAKYDDKKRGFREYKRKIRYRQPFNRTYLTFHNYIPIQSILFCRTLYEELGGFDEKLDILEDWDVWVRYSTKTDFIFVDQITSLYHVPTRKVKRDADMYHAFGEVTKKFAGYEARMNYYEINRELEYILEEIKTPKWKKVLKTLRDRVLYR